MKEANKNNFLRRFVSSKHCDVLRAAFRSVSLWMLEVCGCSELISAQTCCSVRPRVGGEEWCRGGGGLQLHLYLACPWQPRWMEPLGVLASGRLLLALLRCPTSRHCLLLSRYANTSIDSL